MKIERTTACTLVWTTRHIYALGQMLVIGVIKNKKLYDVTEDSLQKRLPQHDFCNPDLYQTPSSFRLVKGHLQSIDGSQKMIHDFDQTLVMVRPKHYVGNSGSTWASDYLNLRWTMPQMFEKSSDMQPYSIQLRLCKQNA